MIAPARRWRAARQLRSLGTAEWRPRTALAGAGLASNLFHAARHAWLGLVAAVAAATITLALVGLALSLDRSLDKAAAGWRSESSARVFVVPSAADGLAEALGRRWENMPFVASSTFVDQVQAKNEFDQMTSDPAVRAAVRPQDLPASWEIRFTGDATPSDIRNLLDTVKLSPEVFRIIDPTRVVERINEIADGVRLMLWSGAVVVAVLWVALTALVMRMTHRARAQEYAVMRLVGATRATIAGPNLLLAALHGLAGGLAATWIMGRAASAVADWAAPRSAWAALARDDALIVTTDSVGAALPWVGVAVALVLAVITGRNTAPRR
jgi:cell division transport system permease protein